MAGRSWPSSIGWEAKCCSVALHRESRGCAGNAYRVGTVLIFKSMDSKQHQHISIRPKTLQRTHIATIPPSASLLLVFFSLSFIRFLSLAFNQQITRIDDRKILTGAIRDELLVNSVINNLLNDSTLTNSLPLSYPSTHESVELGNDHLVESVSSRPIFEFHALAPPENGDRNKSFTLISTDPGTKSRQKLE